MSCTNRGWGRGHFLLLFIKYKRMKILWLLFKSPFFDSRPYFKSNEMNICTGLCLFSRLLSGMLQFYVFIAGLHSVKIFSGIFWKCLNSKQQYKSSTWRWNLSFFCGYGKSSLKSCMAKVESFAESRETFPSDWTSSWVWVKTHSICIASYSGEQL